MSLSLRKHKRRAAIGLEARFIGGSLEFSRRPLAVGWRRNSGAWTGWYSCVWFRSRPKP